MAQTKKTTEVVVKEYNAPSLAEELYVLENQGKAIAERVTEIRTELLAALKHQGVRYIRLDNGDAYTRAQGKRKLVVKNQLKAMKWATENPEARMKIDTGAAMDCAMDGSLPFFAVERGEEYIQIKRGAQLDETNGEVDVG